MPRKPVAQKLVEKPVRTLPTKNKTSPDRPARNYRKSLPNDYGLQPSIHAAFQACIATTQARRGVWLGYPVRLKQFKAMSFALGKRFNERPDPILFGWPFALSKGEWASTSCPNG